MTNHDVIFLQDYATKDDIAVLSYYLSVLQVVVIINSVLIGLSLLLVFTLTAIKCMEDTNHDPSDIRMEDPLWLKGCGLCNSFVELLLCQCIKPLRPKGKPINMFNVPKWRKWHIHDLNLQRGIIEEDVVPLTEEEPEEKKH